MSQQNGRKIHIMPIVVLVLALLVEGVLSAFCWKVISDRKNGILPTLCEYQLVTPGGAQMEPLILRGSAAILITGTEYELQDVLVYRQADGKLSMRRLLEDSGERFQVKGDGEDSSILIAKDTVLGKTEESIPFVGYLLDLLERNYGLLLILGIPGGIFLIIELFFLFAYVARRRRRRRAMASSVPLVVNEQDHFVGVTSQFLSENEKQRVSNYQSPLQATFTPDTQAKPTAPSEEKKPDETIHKVVIPTAKELSAEKKDLLQIYLNGAEEANFPLRGNRSLMLETENFEMKITITKKGVSAEK